MSRLGVSENAESAWLILAFGNFEGLQTHPTAFKDFLSKFEEVSFEPSVIERVFGLMGPERESFRYFQSRETFTNNNPQSAGPFWNGLNPIRQKYFGVIPFCTEHSLAINTPLGPTFDLPWREMWSSYVLLFYLGSLVRYHPAYLENLLDTKEAWLLDQFAHSAPVTLLRYLAIEVLQTQYIFTARI